MKTEQIRLVISIARGNSISKAAEALFISQPTASNMLKALESELGYTIFERTRSGMIPTSKGSEFIEYASVIERSLDAITRIGAQETMIDFKVLSLKSEFAERAFEKLCRDYHHENGKYKLEYQATGNPEGAVRMIELGYSDAGVVLCWKKMYEAAVRHLSKRQLETDILGELHLEVTCRKGHPLIKGGKISYGVLHRYTCFSSVNTSHPDYYLPVFLSKYLNDIEKRIFLDPCDTRYRLLRDMDGFLVSVPISEDIKREYDLVSLPIEDSDQSTFIIYRKDPLKEKLIKEFAEYCRDYI